MELNNQAANSFKISCVYTTGSESTAFTLLSSTDLIFSVAGVSLRQLLWKIICWNRCGAWTQFNCWTLTCPVTWCYFIKLPGALTDVSRCSRGTEVFTVFSLCVNPGIQKLQGCQNLWDQPINLSPTLKASKSSITTKVSPRYPHSSEGLNHSEEKVVLILVISIFSVHFLHTVCLVS